MNTTEKKYKTSKFTRNQRAWLAFIGGALGLMLTNGTYIGIVAVSVASFAERFNCTIADVGFQSTAYCLGLGIVALFGGEIFKKLNLHNAILLGTVITAAGLVLMAVANGLTVIFLGAACAGIGVVLLGPTMIQTTISKWFDTGRATLVGIGGMAESVGVTIFSFLAAHFLSKDPVGGTTTIFYVAAVVVLIVGAIIGLFLVRGVPEDYGWVPVGAEKKDYAKEETTEDAGEVPGITRAEAMKHAQFWLFFATCLVLCFAYYGMYSNQAAYATNILGYTAAQAATLVSITSWAKGLSKIVYGAIGDKFSMRVAYTACICVSIAGVILWMLNLGFGAMIISAIGIGVASALTGGHSVVLSRMYGAKDFLKFTTLPHFANSLGAMLAPFMVKALFDGTRAGFNRIFIVTLVGYVLFLIGVQITMRKDKMFEK